MPDPTVKLGSIARFNPRPSALDLTFDTPVAYVTPSMLSAADASASPHVRQMAAIAKTALHFEDGDLLVASQLTALQAGKAAQARIRQAHGFCAAQMYVIRADREALDPLYLLHFLRQPGLRQLIAHYLKDDTGRHPPALEFLKRLLIPLPPLAQQQRLTVGLNWAMRRCIVLRRMITQCDQVQAAYFYDCFGAAAHLFTRWRPSMLGQTVDEIIFGSARWARLSANQGALLIQRGNLGSNRLMLDDPAYVRTTAADAQHRTRVMAGDVLMTTSAPFGLSAVMPEGIGLAFAGKGVAILRGGSLSPHFLAAYLASAIGQAEIATASRTPDGGAPRPHLTVNGLYGLCVPLVARPEERQFALGCSALTHARAATDARLRSMQARFAALERMTFGNMQATAKPASRLTAADALAARL